MSAMHKIAGIGGAVLAVSAVSLGITAAASPTPSPTPTPSQTAPLTLAKGCWVDVFNESEPVPSDPGARIAPSNTTPEQAIAGLRAALISTTSPVAASSVDAVAAAAPRPAQTAFDKAEIAVLGSLTEHSRPSSSERVYVSRNTNRQVVGHVTVSQTPIGSWEVAQESIFLPQADCNKRQM